MDHCAAGSSGRCGRAGELAPYGFWCGVYGQIWLCINMQQCACGVNKYSPETRKYSRFFEQLCLRSQIREFWEGCVQLWQSATCVLLRSYRLQIVLRNSPFQPLILPISSPDMLNIAPWNRPFRTLIKPIPQSAVIFHVMQQQSDCHRKARFALRHPLSTPLRFSILRKIFVKIFYFENEYLFIFSAL